MRPDMIREPTLRELIQADSLSEVYAVGQLGGFALNFRYGGTERLLANARGSIRLFANLTTLAAYLQRLGIDKFEVDATHYAAGRLRAARPDRAEALRNTRTRMRQADLLESVAVASR